MALIQKPAHLKVGSSIHGSGTLKGQTGRTIFTNIFLDPLCYRLVLFHRRNPGEPPKWKTDIISDRFRRPVSILCINLLQNAPLSMRYQLYKHP